MLQQHQQQIRTTANFLLGISLMAFVAGCSDSPLIPSEELEPVAESMQPNDPIMAMECRIAHRDGSFPATTTVYWKRNDGEVELFVCKQPLASPPGELMSCVIDEDGNLNCRVDWNPAVAPTFSWLVNGKKFFGETTIDWPPAEKSAADDESSQADGSGDARPDPDDSKVDSSKRDSSNGTTEDKSGGNVDNRL